MRKLRKRITAMILAAAVVFHAGNVSVYAGGLRDIELQNAEEKIQDEGSLPDPCNVSGEYGVLNQTNYEYVEGYICDVYEYSIPDDIVLFAKRYQKEAERTGYTVSEGTLEGYEAYAVSRNGMSAYLIMMPDENTMLFLVEQGMPFSFQQAPLTLDQIAMSDEFLYPVDNYAELTIDGEKEIMYLGYAANTGTMLSLNFYSYYPSGQYQHCLHMSIHSDIKEGTAYTYEYRNTFSFFHNRKYSPYSDEWYDYYKPDKDKSNIRYQADYISEDRKTYQISGSAKLYHLGNSRKYDAEDMSFTLHFTLGETNPVYDLYDGYWEEIYGMARPD